MLFWCPVFGRLLAYLKNLHVVFFVIINSVLFKLLGVWDY